MAFGWLKKLGRVGQSVVAIGAVIDPVHFAPVEAVMEAIQKATPDQPGADKKATVIAISDAILESEIGLTDEQVASLKGVQSAWIDAYVQSRKAETALVQAEQAFKAAIAAFKP